MKTTPHLIINNKKSMLSRTLFSDLQLDKILSEPAISILQTPCGQEELLRRRELFALLEDECKLDRLRDCLICLKDGEKSLSLLREARLPLERYFLQVDAYAAYITACESLASFADLGSLFFEVSEYFSSNEKKGLIAEMRRDHEAAKGLLAAMQSGLLSFSDKSWMTPAYGTIGEFDDVAVLATGLGFSVPVKKKLNARIDASLSDALCRLHSYEVGKLEKIFEKYAEVDLNEPFEYISEIRFFLEICDLVERAEKFCVPHCAPEIAKAPLYTAEDIYDISLLAKKCERIVPNDVELTETEPFFFLTGANGGGKTTYLRAVGINLVLFLSGCPIFARKASIYPFDLVASHFPEDERFDNVGRLDEELDRANVMLDAANGKKALLLFNEAFSGTDAKRGFELLLNTADKIGKAKHFGFYVTHFHEVMATDFPVLSAEIASGDENRRTYRIVRSKESASSYAADILKKYRLDKESLKARRGGYGN